MLKNSNSFEEAKSLHSNLIWQQLELITVSEAIDVWLSTLSPKTRINYQSGMRLLAELGLISPLLNLQAFSLVNHEAIIDRIKLVPKWSECSCQSRAACYISFTRFLHRRSQGLITRAIPNREGNAKTFFKVYDKVKTLAMTQSQWILFLEELDKISPRECLMAKLIIQGGKRVNEVLFLKTQDIDWERNKIVFEQSKTRGLKKTTVITYPQSVMQKLKEYIGDRNGVVFITRTGKPVKLNQLAQTFAKAGNHAAIPFKVTPHVLRTSTVTYFKQQGFHDSDIMKVTGHASAAMVNAYDKTSLEANATEKVQLVS
ncbi:MAG: site-specific integrase [Parachlamydiaceae bacterium]|nr:site-specific integrase [Parachlamydiaceae bacterium]